PPPPPPTADCLLTVSSAAVFNPTWFYAGVVYAAAVAMARRAGVELPKRVAVFFYALVLVFLFLPLTQDYVNVPVDFLKTLSPWAYTTDDRTAVNPQINDIALQIVPWAHQVRESWKSLSPPLWNPLAACGYPLLASAQSSALSPLRILGLPLSLGHSMTFEAAMKILIALTFMFLWCRRRGYSELASTAGAVAFGFSSFILVWLHFPLITTACLVPAVFYLIDLLAERFTYTRFVMGAAIWTAMLFGGHPETVSHTFFIAALYVAWILFAERGTAGRTRQFLLSLFGLLAVAGLLSLPLLLPFFESVPKSKRFHELKANATSVEVPFSDGPSAKLLVQPQFYGELPYETKPWGPAHAESITGFAGTLGIAAWFVLLAHVIRRRAWRSREMFFVLATVLVVGIILSWPGLRELFHLVFQLAANARLRLFLCLLLAIQTAAAIDVFARDRASALIGLSAAAALLLGVTLTADFTVPAYRDGSIEAMLPAFGVLLLAFIAVSVKRKDIAVLLLLVAIIGELWETTGNWNPVVPNEWMYPKTPLLTKLDELTAGIPANDPYRITANGPAFFPNVAAVYGYEDIRAHDPMANGRYIGLLALIINYDAANYFAEWNEFERRLIDYLNVRYVVATPNAVLPPRYRMLYDSEDGRIFENPDALPRFFAARNVILEFRDTYFYQNLKATEDWANTAFLENLTLETEAQRGDFFNPRPKTAPMATTQILEASATEYRLRVKAPRYSLIVSSVPWWSGWKVERNGARIEPTRVNGGFLSFTVPPGESDVRVWYDPWTFRVGSIIALVTLAGLIAIGVKMRRDSR
ncbi:MAG: YfhO family protein, partial [Acidobacteriota bacterium]|nr:YfhO family protein [Acidobacteriota bacterium]